MNPAKKQRIAIIGARGYPFVYSGFETLVTELAPRLRDRYEIHVYCHRGLFPERPPVVDGIRLHYLPGIETKHLNQLTHGLLATLHCLVHGFDLTLFLNSCHVPFGFLLKLFGRRCILNTDGVEWRKPQVGWAGRIYYRLCTRFAGRGFDAVISDSREIANFQRAQFNLATTYIAYGANPETPATPPVLHGVPFTPRSYFLVGGRLIPDNNFEIILRGFLRSRTPLKLVVLGDTLFPSRYDRELKKMASDRIHFTGFVRDPRALRGWFKYCYAYFHGHQYGGTNPILLEALASDCCVAALDGIYNREVLADSDYGLYFQKSVDSVAALAEYLVASPQVCEAYRQKSRRRILTRYSWNEVADDYDRLFCHVLRPRSAARQKKVPEYCRTLR